MFTESAIYKMETRETLLESSIRFYFTYMDETDFLLFLLLPIAATSLLIRFVTRFCCKKNKGSETRVKIICCHKCRDLEKEGKVEEEKPQEQSKKPTGKNKKDKL